MCASCEIRYHLTPWVLGIWEVRSTGWAVFWRDVSSEIPVVSHLHGSQPFLFAHGVPTRSQAGTYTYQQVLPLQAPRHRQWEPCCSPLVPACDELTSNRDSALPTSDLEEIAPVCALVTTVLSLCAVCSPCCNYTDCYGICYIWKMPLREAYRKSY